MADRLEALTVRESNGKSFWTRIGVAFPNKNGPGYIVRLDAVPASVDGQYTIHLREPRQGGAESGGNNARNRTNPRDSGGAQDDWDVGF